MPPPTMPEPPATPGPMRQQIVNKINEVQQLERAMNTDDDVVSDILKVVTFGARGRNESTLGVSSITQHSERGEDNRLAVTLAFLADYDTEGVFQFEGRGTRRTDGRTATISTRDEEATVNRLDEIPAPNWKGLELQSETNTFHHYADFFSDIENSGDTDYLAMGYWLWVRKERSSTETNYYLSVGAGGNDHFGVDKLPGLTGTASFEGHATGLRMTKENAGAAAVFDYFNAKASLTAEFGDASELGTVSGTITEGMTQRGEPLPEVTLGSAEIRESSGSFFGDTSGDGLAGRWAGKFYGNGATETDHPDSTAGTFGAKTEDNLQSVVGAFAAYRN